MGLTAALLDEWCAYLDNVISIQHDLITIGDLNVHLDNKSDVDVQ